MENSINTNESSGIDSEEKKQSENNNLKNQNNVEKGDIKENNENVKKEEKENKEINEDNKEKEEDIKKIEEENREKIENKKEIEEEKIEDNKEKGEEGKEIKEDNKEKEKEEEERKEIISEEKKDNENENIKNDDTDDKKEKKKDEKEEKYENEIQYNNMLLKNVEKYDIQKLPDNYEKEDASYKILFLGDSGVGKSSLVIRGIKQKFDSFYKPTVGFDLLSYTVKIKDKVIKMQIWDTCGQEEFSICNQSLFKNASIAILVYSISSKKSFENIKKWISRVKDLSNENAIFFLVGNKSDLFSQRQISFNEGKNYGLNEFKFFIETSSKYGYNVDILFKEIVIYLYENNFASESEKENNDSKEEDFFSRGQSSSLLDSKNIYLHNNKKCLKCC